MQETLSSVLLLASGFLCSLRKEKQVSKPTCYDFVSKHIAIDVESCYNDCSKSNER